jgi:hypothetical protein
MDLTSRNIKSLAALINQKNGNTPYQQIFLDSNENEQKNACSNFGLLNALQEIISLNFNPSQKFYPFSAKMESGIHKQLIEQLLKEVTFYDALCTNGSAESIMDDDQLRSLAQDLVLMVHSRIAVDWTLRGSARGEAIRGDVKQLIRKYKYPANKELLATDRIIEQAETLCEDWAK